MCLYERNGELQIFLSDLQFQVSLKGCDSRQDLLPVGTDKNKTHGNPDYQTRDNRNRYVCQQTNKQRRWLQWPEKHNTDE